MQLALSQRNLDEGSNPSFCAGRKLGEVEQALLWNLLHEDSSSPSRVLLDKVAHMQRPIAVSIRHLNRWRVTWGLNRGKGRPHQAQGHRPGGRRRRRRLVSCPGLAAGFNSERFIA